jgi:RNA polymerase sigma-70 factor (ECF subfamily)
VNRRDAATPTHADRDQSVPDPDAAAVRAAGGAVRQGDRDAFDVLVHLYQRRLFGLALMMVRDAAAEEEIAQDAFVNAFTHLDFYDERRPFYPWLATIAVRRAQNWLRQHSRTAARERASLDSRSEHAPGPLEELIADESERRLWRIVEAIPSGERTVVMLYYRQEMAVGDIAHALGVTSGTVKTLLFRARRRLRRTILDANKPNVNEDKRL